MLHRQGFDGLEEVERCVLEPGGTFYIQRKMPPAEEVEHAEVMRRLDGTQRQAGPAARADRRRALSSNPGRALFMPVRTGLKGVAECQQQVFRKWRFHHLQRHRQVLRETARQNQRRQSRQIASRGRFP